MNTSFFSWNRLYIFIFIWGVLGLISCDKATLSENTALNAVENYLKSNSIYETTDLEIGEIKFRLKKDEIKLNAYKELADKGYIEFELAKEKKKFLKRDSVYVYGVRLKDKARPFVIKQKKNKVEVKSFEYQLDEKDKANLVLSGKKSGSVAVTLKKEKTDFAVLAQDKNPHSTFITRTFSLKYKKDEGWIVTKDK